MSHDTEFAGLTELDPGDPITAAGAAFTQKNPSRTDFYLRIGAVTHKHDAHPKLGDPTQTVASANSQAWPVGQIAADTQLFIAYTLTDKYGGESRRGPAATLTTAAGFAAPSAAIGASFISSAGTLPVGQFAYALTLNDGTGGESTLGPAVFIQRPSGFPNGEILLTGLAQELAHSGVGWASWNLWRAQDGGAFQLVAANQIGNSFIDDGLICTDAARVPPNTMNNVAATNALFFTLPTVGAEPGLASATTVNVYISLDGSFSDQCYYASYPAMASAGQQVEADSLTLHPGSPPNVSLTSQGASQIDPDSDLLDWHWKRPVHDPSALPMTGNASGDVRASLSPEALFVWDGTRWGVVAAASGVGGAGGGGLGSIILTNVYNSASAKIAPALYLEGDGQRIYTEVFNRGGGSGVMHIHAPDQVASAAGGASASMYAQLELVGSGGITVEVIQEPNQFAAHWGSARVVINLASGGVGGTGPPGPTGASGAPGAAGPAGSAANFVASAGTASAIVGPFLGFAGSGGVAVQLVQQSGSAVVLISASGIQGVPGTPGAPGAPGAQGPAGTGGGVNLAGSAGVNPTMFGSETYLEFAGSGGTGVAVQNLGGGSARILISASGVAGPQGPQGAQGPAGTGGGGGVGGAYLAGSAGANPTPFGAESYMEFVGSGGTGVAVQNLGGGSARVVIGDGHTIAKATQASGYVVQAIDMGTVIESASAGAGSASVGYLIAPSAQVLYPTDSIVEFFQYGTGQVQIVPSAGVTLRSDGARSKIAAQFGTIQGRYRGGDEWVLSGDLT